MAHYCFDGTMTGLLSCVFRAFEFKDFDVKVMANPQAQNGLFDDFIHVASNESHGQRVWQGLKQKISSSSLKAFYYAFLSEKNRHFRTCSILRSMYSKISGRLIKIMAIMQSSECHNG